MTSYLAHTDTKNDFVIKVLLKYLKCEFGRFRAFDEVG